MDNDQILIVLKYAGSTIAAAYGVYATLTDFREERSGKKVLSRKGYFGIALLLVSAIFALSTSALKDYQDAKKEEVKTRQDEKKRDEDLAKINAILSGLTTVTGQLKGTQEALSANSVTTQGIATNLGTQLDLSTIMSTRLTGVTATLLDTSNKTGELLSENIENISFIDMIVEFKIDPAAIKDESGKNILSAELLEGLRNGSPDRSEIVKQLRAHSSLIRNLVGQEVSIVSIWGKEVGERRGFQFFPGIIKQQDVFSGNDRMSFFIIYEDSTFQTESDAIVCLLTYRSLPNRYTGVRKFKDLNGLTWQVYLKLETLAFKPLAVAVDVGQAKLFEKQNLLVLSLEKIDPEPTHSVVSRLEGSDDGNFSGELTIPAEFF